MFKKMVKMLFIGRSEQVFFVIKKLICSNFIVNWKSSLKKKALLKLNDNFIGFLCLYFLYFLLEALIFGSYPLNNSRSQGKAWCLMSGLVSDKGISSQ